MKIDIINPDLLKNGKKKMLSRKIKKGIIIAALVVGIPTLMFSSKKRDEFNNPPAGPEEFSDVVLEDPISVSLDEVNSMNIIINDNDCSDIFMENIYNKLQEDGIIFSTTKNSENINVDDAVVITLDQQYISGPGMVILAPYDNDRLGNSDALALAANTAFYENGFFTDGIESGKRGFKEDVTGVVMERVPSNTEEKIDNTKNTSFVTICFGTDNVNTDLVASSIENMLIRYHSYINNDDIKEDLIYRDGDKTIKNPSVKNIREFNSKVPVKSSFETTKWLR